MTPKGKQPWHEKAARAFGTYLGDTRTKETKAISARLGDPQGRSEARDKKDRRITVAFNEYDGRTVIVNLKPRPFGKWDRIHTMWVKRNGKTYGHSNESRLDYLKAMIKAAERAHRLLVKHAPK